MGNISVLLVVFLVAVILGTAEVSKEMNEKLLEISRACIEKTGVSEELVAGAMSGEFPDDPKLTEQLLCIGHTSGFLDENGKHHTENIRLSLTKMFGDEAIANAIIDACAQNKDTPEETALEGAKCFYKQYQKYIPV